MSAPEPFLPADVDVRDLDGFMLNVERLMASELVALSTHEEIAAAVFLWCRAWKQVPAASLPDDDRVIASFARLPLARFKKSKATILRGFVKCSDGRLYHRFLAEEAVKAFDRKKAFQGRRATDAKRLKEWRQKQRGNGEETHDETNNETRFVAEGQGQGQGQGPKDNTSTPEQASPKKDSGSIAGASAPPTSAPVVPIRPPSSGKTLGHAATGKRPELSAEDRKDIWFQKLIRIAKQEHGEEWTGRWMLAYDAGEPWAKREAERLNAILRAEEAAENAALVDAEQGR